MKFLVALYLKVDLRGVFGAPNEFDEEILPICLSTLWQLQRDVLLSALGNSSMLGLC